MGLFRKLEEHEESEYRKWARDYYIPFSPINGVWHPVTQDECVKMNRETGEKFNEYLETKNDQERYESITH
jgi:hypothetical protein